MASDAYQLAQQALSRFTGGNAVDQITPMNVGPGRFIGEADDINVATNTEGASHQKYRQDIIDKAAAEAKAKADAEAARKAQLSAAQAAAEAAAKAQQQQAAAAAAPAAPAAPAAAPTPSYTKYNTTKYTSGPYSNDTFAVGAGNDWMNVTKKNMYDPEIQAQLFRSRDTYNSDKVANSSLSGLASFIDNLYNPATKPTTMIGSAPIKGGGRDWTWQQDQAYWSQLDNYNKANMLGSYA